MRPPIEGLDSPLCVDSTGLLAQERVPKRLVVLGGGIIGCEFASIFQRFGSEVTIVEMLPSLIPMKDKDGALSVHFGVPGENETKKVEADLMLVAVGRAPLVEGLGLVELGVQVDRKSGIATDEHRRTA